jgi:hypothetical protein
MEGKRFVKNCHKINSLNRQQPWIFSDSYGYQFRKAFIIVCFYLTSFIFSVTPQTLYTV